MGADFIRTDIVVKSHGTVEPYGDRSFRDTHLNSKTRDAKYGFGFHYKYAININNFFIAPGLFYESIGSKSEISKTNYSNDASSDFAYRQTLEIRDRYGVKFDIGFDISDKFATYVPLGYASTSYELNTRESELADSAGLSTKTTERTSGLLYGLGFSFYPSEKIAINLEYNRSKVNARTGQGVSFNGGNSPVKAKANLDIIKLGASYKF